MQKRVAFHTLGCKLNFSETSAIGRQFRTAGFSSTDFDSEADVYVINTCSVTAEANKTCRNVVRRALRQNPNGYVIVVGCYAQLKPQEIADIPGVDMVLGAGDKFRILDIVKDFEKEDNACVYNSAIGEINDFVDAYSIGDRTRTFLKIQDGCDYKCSFCTIPLARGKSRSDSLENVLTNARNIAQAGVKEIVLTGVNTGDYGKDQPEDFIDVVHALDADAGLDGVDRIRISSIEPNLCHDDVIQFVSQSKRFAPHFHMPLQSGDDEMLAAMRRRYRSDLYTQRVELIKKLMPHACIGVDVIVGFPGETEQHFLNTYEYLNKLNVSYFHVFTYSERENTLAWDMEGVVDKAERKRRTNMLRILSEKKRRAFYQQFEGTTMPVLWEGAETNGFMFGFTPNYIKVARPFEEGFANTIQETRLGEVNPEGVMLAGATVGV